MIVASASHNKSDVLLELYRGASTFIPTSSSLKLLNGPSSIDNIDNSLPCGKKCSCTVFKLKEFHLNLAK